jgi:pentatricopeptide repeat domain (PPR motif)
MGTTKGKENHHQKKRRIHVNVHTKTALMKGYAHSGRIDKAEKIYLDMQTHQGQGGNYQGPNVRTLNTLLRGCLWAAVSLEEKGGGNQINGGVVTADIVWPKGTSSKTIVPDTSSYEYYISLLSQALRCQDAQKVLDEFMRAFHVKVINQDDSDHCRYQGDASVLETLGNSLFQLARAHAILGNHTEAKSCARKVLDVIASTKEKCLDTSTAMQQRNKFQTTGGKRGKKELHMDGSRRELSNTLFRNHKMDELEMNAKDVLDKSSCMTCDPFALAQQFSTKVLYFAGGGTTDLSVLQTYTNDIRDEETMALDSRKQRKQLLNALWFSFGLSQVMNKAFPDESFCSEKLHHGRPMPLTKKECSKILKALNLTESYVICEDGTIDFSAIFKGNHNQATSSKKRELNIELGSGFGEWAVHQAQSNPFHDYVAVELRSDRVSLTFSKAYLQSGQGRYPLNNLCCVGAECGSFLGMRVKPNTVSRIFVNHPEPPTQTIGANNSLLKRISDGGEEPAHMLNSATLVKAARCLDSEKGQMVIVTDNRWYANLICATFLKVMKQERGIFFSTPLDGTSAIRPIDVFYADSNLLSITLYEGQPNEFIGHSTACVASQSSGSTYFDRLWRKGAGSHADVKKRFIICVSRHEKSRPQHVNSSKKAKQKLNKRNGKL